MTDAAVSVDLENPPDEALEKVALAVRGSLERAVLRAAEFAAGELRREVRDSFQQWTGKLGRSYRATLVEKESDGKASAGAFSDLLYAGILDQGATIKPKGQWLTVPISDRAKALSRKGDGALQMPNLFFIKGKKGPLLAESIGRGKRSRLVIHWALRKSVTVPREGHQGRGYIERALERLRDELPELVGEEVIASIESGAE